MMLLTVVECALCITLLSTGGTLLSCFPHPSVEPRIELLVTEILGYHRLSKIRPFVAGVVVAVAHGPLL